MGLKDIIGNWILTGSAAAGLLLGCATRDPALLLKARTHRQLGDGFAEDGKFPEALAQYKEAHRLDPKSHEIMGLLGRTYFAMKRPDEAADWTLRACQAVPTEGHCWNTLAAIELSRGRPKSSKAAAERALALDTFPEPESALATLAQAEVELGKMREADRHSSRAVQLKPEHCGLRIVRSHVLLKKGDFEDALFHAEWGARRCPFDPHNLAWVAYSRYRIGHHRVARRVLRDLIERFPSALQAEWAQRSLEALKQRRPLKEPLL